MDVNLKKSINDIVRNRRLYTASTNKQEVVMADKSDIKTLKVLLRDSISMLRICVNLANDSKSPYYGSVAGRKIKDAYDDLKEALEKIK